MDRNERKAAAEIFEAHRALVEGVALRETGNADEAADVVGEVALRLCKVRGEIREPGAWLARVTRNEAIRLRGRRRIAEVSIETVEIKVSSGVEERIAARERRDDVRRALAVVPASDRRIVVRCFDGDGESIAGVAVRLGVHRRTVERARRRTFNAMRETLETQKRRQKV